MGRRRIERPDRQRGVHVEIDGYNASVKAQTVNGGVSSDSLGDDHQSAPSAWSENVGTKLGGAERQFT